jgi:DNA-binding NtrC family response regulator
MAATCRILIVDDDQPVRETLADLLDISGFETVVAADAAEAVMILREPPGIDVLVTDLSMPGADGIVLIRQARMIRPDIPAILLTGYAEEAMSVSLAGNSNFHILRKPFEGSRLIEQIKILLDNRPTP